jgi:hypothetical protein
MKLKFQELRIFIFNAGPILKLYDQMEECDYISGQITVSSNPTEKSANYTYNNMYIQLGTIVP